MNAQNSKSLTNEQGIIVIVAILAIAPFIVNGTVDRIINNLFSVFSAFFSLLTM